RAELAAFQKDVDARKADLQVQLGKAREELKAVEAGVTGDGREPYNRGGQLKDADAFASGEHGGWEAGNCADTGSSMTVLRREAFVTCKSCGRILYLPEEPQAAGEGE